MPHEISKTADGRDAMIYAGLPPWHRLGTKLDSSESKDLDLALEAAGLGFEVVKRPRHTLEAMEPDDHGTADVTRDGVRYRVRRGDKPYAVVRADTRTELGTVEEHWHPLQNREALEPLREALDRGLASIETGGVLREGRDVWMLVRFDRDHVLRTARERAGSGTVPAFRRLVDTLEGEPGGGILPYGLLYNDHSGARHAQVKQTAVRVVCANTLEWALDGSLWRRGGTAVEVRHDRNVVLSYRDAVKAMFCELTERYQALADQREVLKKTVLSEEEFERMVATPAARVWMFGPVRIRGRDRPDRLFFQARRASRRESRGEIRRLWDEGAGNRGDRSAWEAYNGLVQWLDHSRSASPEEDRLEGLLRGTLGDTKRRVYARLLEHATGHQDAIRPVGGVFGAPPYRLEPAADRARSAARAGDRNARAAGEHDREAHGAAEREGQDRTERDRPLEVGALT